MSDAPFPFSAVVGADDVKLALVLAGMDVRIGGVLLRGDKGSAKSTLARGLAALMPGSAPFVELPVGATEDRLVGSLDIAAALSGGEMRFREGLLAAAHGGVLYVDEVNLLPDHLVDALLDVAASGINRVEREGVAHVHASHFVLIGSMNPEEGELRPQFLDRFGLCVDVTAPSDPASRAEAVLRRLAFDVDPVSEAAGWVTDESALAERMAVAVGSGPAALGAPLVASVAALCVAVGVEGLRADLVICRAAAALARWEGRAEAAADDVRRVAPLALAHRARRGPLDPHGLDPDQLEAALDEHLGVGPYGAGGAAQGGPGRTVPGDDDDDAGDEAGAGDDDDDAGDEAGALDGAGGGDGAGGALDADDDAGVAAETGSPAGDAGAGGPSGTHGSGPRTATGGAGTASASAPDRVAAPGETMRVARLEVGGAGPRPAGAASGRRSMARSVRGRMVGDRVPGAAGPGAVAVTATVRAALSRQPATSEGYSVEEVDLREAVREERTGNLVILAVDASASMGVERRMEAAKGAVMGLLVDAYQRRDRVALVTFRGEEATVVLRPTASVEIARVRLAELPTGGRTPLAAGIRAALAQAGSAVAATHRPLIVLVTDGRATAASDGDDPIDAARAAAQAVRRQGCAAAVVDVEEGPTRLGLAAEIATAMGATLVTLPELDGGGLITAVRLAQSARRR